MKAALYCKFPVDETGGPEILEQELILISLLQKIDGELYAIYVDRGNTLSVPEASFLQMVQDGLAHRFDVLLCVTPKLFCQKQNKELFHLITIFPECMFCQNNFSEKSHTHLPDSHTITI